MSRPFAYQNLNESQNELFNQQTDSTAPVGVPQTPQFIQLRHFNLPQESDSQMQYAMSNPQMQGHQQIGSMIVPMGIPLQGPGNQMVMMLPMPANQQNATRVREIETILDHGYGCYKCWLWFSFIIQLIMALSDLAVMSNKEFKSVLFVFLLDIITSGITCYAYFQGITAMKMKNLEKNELFKRWLILSTILTLIAGFVRAIESKELATATSNAFGVSPDPSQDGGKTGALSGAILQLLISGLVYYTADKISRLLKDRKELLAVNLE
jgi:hypothetical protein